MQNHTSDTELKMKIMCSILLAVCPQNIETFFSPFYITQCIVNT